MGAARQTAAHSSNIASDSFISVHDCKRLYGKKLLKGSSSVQPGNATQLPQPRSPQHNLPPSPPPSPRAHFTSFRGSSQQQQTTTNQPKNKQQSSKKSKPCRPACHHQTHHDSPQQNKQTNKQTNKHHPGSRFVCHEGAYGYPSFLDSSSESSLRPTVGCWMEDITHAFCRVRSQACGIHPIHSVLRGAHVDAARQARTT
jgi:hypothetical protein